MSLSLASSRIVPGRMVDDEDRDCGGRFIPDLKKVKLVKSLSPNAEIWTLYYELSPLVSPRVFTVLQVKQLKEFESRREGYVLILFLYLVTRMEG